VTAAMLAAAWRFLGEPVVASGNSAEILQPTEHSLDRVPVPVKASARSSSFWLGWTLATDV
jgi:hypothetical protein